MRFANMTPREKARAIQPGAFVTVNVWKVNRGTPTRGRIVYKNGSYIGVDVGEYVGEYYPEELLEFHGGVEGWRGGQDLPLFNGELENA